MACESGSGIPSPSLRLLPGAVCPLRPLLIWRDVPSPLPPTLR